MKSKLSFLSVSLCVLSSFVLFGCDQGDERLAQKAKIEGQETAKADLQTQVDNIDKKVELARAEGKAQAQAELQAQIENMELLLQKARAEGRAQAEAGISAQNGNLAEKSQEMEADLTTRQLFYRAVRGTYEGSMSTEAGDFKVRITLVPSLPTYGVNRVRQLDEITADINNLYFNAQVVQWNPANKLSAVGCRIENVRPDLNSGEISIASSNCPNLYVLRISDPQFVKANSKDQGEDREKEHSGSQNNMSVVLASSIREGKMTALPQIVGEVYPSTNASVYKLTVNRVVNR